MQDGQVGPNGELIPPKEIMEKLGLHPRTKVTYKIESGRLIIEPIPSLKEVLQKKPVVEITLDEAKKIQKRIVKEGGNLNFLTNLPA